MKTQSSSTTAKLFVLQRLRSELIREIIALHPSRVMVLDSTTTARGFARKLEKAGISVEFPDFFAGHLSASNGESVYLTARDLSYTAAARIVGKLIDNSPVLRSVESLGRPGTLNIRLQKSLAMPLFQLAIVLEAARVLSAPHLPTVWVDVPSMLPADSLRVLAPDLETRAMPQPAIAGWVRLSSILTGLAILRGLRAILGLFPSKIDTMQPAPTILTAHEEDLTDDRSYRSMLHWLDFDSDRPRCRTVVMPQRGAHRYNIQAESLEKRRIILYTKHDVARSLRLARSQLQKQLSALIARCFWWSLMAPTGAERNAVMETWRLLGWARDIAAVAEYTGACAWVGCESWQRPMDAVNMIADQLAIKTCVFQYSSIRGATPLMVTTADVAAILGDPYVALFRWENIGPRACKAMGYPYGYAFPLLRERARKLRTKLELLGVKFVLGFFDESVQYSHWGLISRDDHLHELTLLAQAVLEDQTLGVIVKPKYAWNNLKLLYPEDQHLHAALETGRFLVMEKGQHRNAHLPAETALSCDLCIGHLFAASAALEAAFSGTKSVLIRRYGEKTLLDPILARLDVVYQSMDGVLDRIAHLRAGNPEASALGDWSPVLADLDAYRDGKASERLRELLEGWALSDQTQSVTSNRN